MPSFYEYFHKPMTAGLWCVSGWGWGGVKSWSVRFVVFHLKCPISWVVVILACLSVRQVFALRKVGREPLLDGSYIVYSRSWPVYEVAHGYSICGGSSPNVGWDVALVEDNCALSEAGHSPFDTGPDSHVITCLWRVITWFPTVYPTIYLPKWKFWLCLSQF